MGSLVDVLLEAGIGNGRDIAEDLYRHARSETVKRQKIEIEEESDGAYSCDEDWDDEEDVRFDEQLRCDQNRRFQEMVKTDPYYDPEHPYFTRSLGPINDFLRKDSESLANISLDDYNKKHNTAFKYVDLLKISSVLENGLQSYLTFEAKDATNGVTEVFQAFVWNHFSHVTVEICRIRPQRINQGVGTCEGVAS